MSSLAAACRAEFVHACTKIRSLLHRAPADRGAGAGRGGTAAEGATAETGRREARRAGSTLAQARPLLTLAGCAFGPPNGQPC